MIRSIRACATVFGLAAALAAAGPARAADAAEAPQSGDPQAGLDADADAGSQYLGEYDVVVDEPDPLEPSNRLVFAGNEKVYHFLFDPLADGYAFIVPRPVRRSVRHFFDNLGEPAVFLNEVMQLSPRRAGQTGLRFAMNSTVGVLGLFDVAGRVGFPRNDTDFGQTLGVYGIGQGCYLVVPLIGPSSVRDLLGDFVNGFLHPQNYLLAYAPQAILATSGGFTRYEEMRDDLDTLRESSVDFYAAMRSAYLMKREADVRAARASSPVLRGVIGEDVAAAPEEHTARREARAGD